MDTKHALTTDNGPAICGAGNGRKLRQRQPRGLPLDQIEHAPDGAVTCKRCRRLLRKRWPCWMEITSDGQTRLVPRWR